MNIKKNLPGVFHGSLALPQAGGRVVLARLAERLRSQECEVEVVQGALSIRFPPLESAAMGSRMPFGHFSDHLSDLMTLSLTEDGKLVYRFHYWSRLQVFLHASILGTFVLGAPMGTLMHDGRWLQGALCAQLVPVALSWISFRLAEARIRGALKPTASNRLARGEA